MEYALVTATIAAVVAGAFAGLGATLPATARQQDVAVTRAAHAANVPVVDARRAARTAPYARPALRTLYGVGWVLGRADRASCTIAVSTGGSTEQVARDALRRLPQRARTLRAAHVSEATAVRALDRGYRSACK